MILDNLSRALRTQNWLAAGIEFVIVIAGVVIGFQINAWAQARASAEQEAVLLSRLHAEAEANVRYHVSIVSLRERHDRERDDAIVRMLDNDFEGADRETMIQAIIAGSFIQPVAPSRTVYDEVVNGSLASRIGDAEMRAALSEYWSEIDRLRGQLSAQRQSRLAYPEGIAVEEAFFEIRYEPNDGLRRRNVIDLEAAAQSEAFLEHIVRINTLSRLVTIWWARSLDKAVSLCLETARLTGRTCEAAPEASP